MHWSSETVEYAFGEGGKWQSSANAGLSFQAIFLGRESCLSRIRAVVACKASMRGVFCRALRCVSTQTLLAILA